MAYPQELRAVAAADLVNAGLNSAFAHECGCVPLMSILLRETAADGTFVAQAWPQCPFCLGAGTDAAVTGR